MADGGGGGGGGGEGGGWSRDARPELYHGHALNPTPLAALPAPSHPAFNAMGGSGEGGSGERTGAPHVALWRSVPPIAAVPPSGSFPVSIPPVYFAHPPPMPPMEFPALIKLEIPPLRVPGTDASRSPGVGGVMGLPSFYGTPQPRSNLSSGVNEAGVSGGDVTPAAAVQRLDTSIPMPSPTGDQNVSDKSEAEREQQRLSTLVNQEKVVLPIASRISPPTDLVSSDPSVGFIEPPPVPESFPRDPVPQGGRGEGWPYAPQGWPNPDDKWGWRVGKRASASSLWVDRYITVPVSLAKGRRTNSKIEFASRKSLVEFLKQIFPQMKDPYSIFKAFDWKVPAPKNFEAAERRGSSVKRDKPSPAFGEENEQKSKRQCQAGNPHCLLTKAKDTGSKSLGTLACHICCSEPGFCRECKCILCCKFFAPDADDFSIIRCLNSPTSGLGICGHAAHLECALDSQLAGVIKKIGLDMEYMCRRCDRKTDLKETVSRLVSEFMNKTATESKVESSLQLLLRVVQDPEDEARNAGKLQTTLLAALKKAQEGADFVESCKELTEQLHELRSGQGVHDSQVSHQEPNWSDLPALTNWTSNIYPSSGVLTSDHGMNCTGRSRAMGRKREWEDPLHPSETTTDKTVPESNPVGSPDAQIDSMIASQGACEDGVATTSGTRVEPDLDKDKDLPSTSLQDSPKPEDHVSSITTSETPSELLSCTLLLSSVLDRGVSKLPTLSIEEHIRQCEAMVNRVKGAGRLNISPTTPSLSLPGTLEVVLDSDSKPPSVTAGSLTVESHENQVVLPEAEATPSTGLPGAEELVTSIHSSSRVKSSSIFNSQDAAEDHVANTEIIEDVEAIVHNASGSFKTIQEAQRPMMNDGNKTTEDAGGDDTASTKSIKVFKSSRILRPRTSSSEAKGSSLANSQEAGGVDAVITQIIEVPMAEPLTIPIFDPALETAHAAGMEAEFEERISEALEKLKRAQAAEYARAEESLNAQKKIVIEQYRQLENAYVQFGKKENAHVFPHKHKKNHRDKPRAEIDRAMKNLMAQYEKAQEGQKAFDFMLAISNGFGQVSKEFLLEFFNWPPSDIIEA